MTLLRRLAAGLPLLTLALVLVFLAGKKTPVSNARSSQHPPSSPSEPAHKAATYFSTAPEAFDHWLTEWRNNPEQSEIDRGIALARKRRSVLKELIRMDPARALKRAIGRNNREGLPPEVLDLLETPVSTAAGFERVVSCDTAGLARPDDAPSEECFVSFAGKRYRAYPHGRRDRLLTKDRISLLGISLDDIVSVSPDPVRRIPDLSSPTLEAFGEIHQFATEEEAEDYLAMVLADEEAAGPGGVTNAAASTWTEGSKRILYLRVRFADDDPDYEPVTLATAQSHQDDVAEHYRIASYGKLNVTTVFPDMITLSQNKSAYVGNALGTMMNEARDIAITMGQAQGVDWDYRNFDFYTIISDRGIGPYAGVAQVGGRKSHHQRGYTSLRTSGHEFGHNLGLLHAFYNYSKDLSPRGTTPTNGLGRVEYGHRFSVMSAQSGRDFDNPALPHFTVHEKWRLNWITDTDIVDITSGDQSGTYRLYQNDLEGVTGLKALRVPSGGDLSKYWLSYRTSWKRPNRGSDNDYLLNGLLFNWTGSGGGTSTLLDMTPYSNPGSTSGARWTQDNGDKWDAPLLIGRTYTDAESKVSITPVARGGSAPNEYLDVHVHLDVGSEEILVGEGVTCRAIIPDAGTTSGTSWTEVSFDDNGWDFSGTLGVGYDTGSDYNAFFGVDVQAMRSVNESCYIRVPFNLDPELAPTSIESLRLDMRFDDGFVAYLNGVKVAEANAPSNPQWDSGATRTNSDGNAVNYRSFDASSGVSALVSGQNVLAIHGLNSGTNSSDFLMQPVLTAITSGQPNNRPVVSLAASTLIANINQEVTFTASASDPDGDALAYSWDFDIGNTFAPEGLNNAVATRQWSAAGNYVVTVTCSDLKGGVSRDQLLVKVGSPTAEGKVTGRVFQGGQPVAGARVFVEGSDKQTTTLNDGTFLLAGLSASSPVTLGAMLDGDVFQPAITMPIVLGNEPGHVDFWGHAPPPPGSPDQALILSPTVASTEIASPLQLEARLWDNTIAEDPLVPFGALWRYLDTGTAPDNRWIETGFDDSSWLEGSAELGYGDSQNTVVSFGADSSNKHITTWFRNIFTVTNAAEISRLKLSVKRDDGIRVFLNGTEVARDNLSSGTVNPNTKALNEVSSSVEEILLTYPVNPSLLLEGQNIITAEVHQEDEDSSDLSFDLELSAARNFNAIKPSWSVTPVGATVSPEGVFTATQPGTYTVTATSGSVMKELEIPVSSEGSIGIVALQDFVGEYDPSAQFRITRTGVLSEPATIPLIISGTATNGSDYSGIPATVFFPAEVARIDLNLVPFNDDLEEGHETISVSLNADGVLATVDPALATMTILDDDNNIATQPEAGDDGVATTQTSYQLSGSLTGVEALVGRSTDWRYHDQGVALPATWRDRGFDDRLWARGRAKFGYGDNNEITTIDFGENSSNKHITTYFRRRFHLDNPADYNGLVASLLVDDGAVIYLNGTEVRRINLPSGTISFSTRANGAVGGSDETTFVAWTLDESQLVAGENIIAVEVHQNSPSSSDLGFDLGLDAPLAHPVSSPNVIWTRESGPGAAVFVDSGDPATGVTFDLAGTYVLRLTDQDSGRFDQVTILVEEARSYQQWIGDYTVTDPGPLVDSDLDGVANLLEYAFGGDPTVAGDLEGPTLSEDPAPTGDLIFSYPRLREQSSGDASGTTGEGYLIYGISYTVQASDTFGRWSTASSVLNVQLDAPPVDQGDGTELVRLRLTPPPGNTSQWFVRLRVTSE